jgi:hypothetical protein
MVYLSANGEVIGQFEESELPGMLSTGKISPDAYFWREGMPDWRPVRELPPPRPARSSPIKPKLTISPQPVSRSAAQRPAAAATATASPLQQPVKPAAAAQTPKPTQLEVSPSPIQPRVEQADPAPVGQAPRPSAADSSAADPAAKPAPHRAKAPPVAARLHEGPPDQGLVTAAPAQARGRGWLAGLLALLLLVAAAGGAAWWFLTPAEPPAIEGEVRWEAVDGGLNPVAGAQVLLVSRAELVEGWGRELSRAAERRSALAVQIEEARAAHREKQLAHELAARQAELAEEYNMAEAVALRETSDSLQAEEAAALAEVENHVRELEFLGSHAVVFGHQPAAEERMPTDAEGRFRMILPPDVEGMSLLILAENIGGTAGRTEAWLVPADLAEMPPGPRRFSPDNALRPEDILQLAGGTDPGR